MVKARQNDYSRRIEALGHSTPMDKRLLDILCDPVSKTPLKLLSKTQLDVLNRAIRSNEIRTTDGRPVAGSVDAGLVTIDGKVIYRIEDGIPVLLADEAIGTVQLHDFPR
jgi:uncharacterized protein YbaR (Trm112 family)